MLDSSLPSRRANSSSSIPFIPRQVMLESKCAVAAKEDGKERRKEKERKNRSSETLQLDRAEAGGAPHKGQGRDVLLRSIAAFLDSSGFSKTLSVLQSEAQLEIGCWKSSSFVNLEDLFCKFLDSSCSNGHAEATIDWPRDQDLQKVIISGEMEGKNMNCGPENTHKKKRKRTDRFDDGMETKANETLMEKGLGEGVNNGENLAVDGLQDKFKKKNTVGLASEGLFADNANISSDNLKVLTALNENSDPKKLKTAEDLHAETKEKKKKKKKVHDPSTDGAENKHSEVSHVTVESTDPANQSPEPREKHKEKKKKHKVMPEIHDEIAESSDSGKLKESVKAKMEEVISLTNNSFEPNMKHKSEKKKEKKLKQVQLEASECTSNKNPKDMKLVSTESQTGLASTNPLDDNDSQHKVKKKKPKSCFDVVSTVSPDQAGEEKSTNQIKEFDFNQDIEASDFGHRSIPASEDLNIKVAKKVSKKRKVVDLGEKAENEIARKEPKVKSEGAEDNEVAESIVRSDKSILDSDNPVKTKKRKTEECKESSKNAGEQLDLSIECKKNGSASNSKNEVVGHQLENGSIGNNSKKEQRSAEPKSVNPFQRVKVDEVKFVDDRLKDNSYWAKDGADSGYGAKAQEVLGQVRGRDFRHEKIKKKRGTYRGGQIDLQSHSIKFNYSDDD